MKKLLFLALTVTLFAACGGGETTTQTTEQEQTQVVEQTDDAKKSITIEGDDAMQFDLKTIEVMEGQTVELTLKHTGTMAKEVMGHNWVLLKSGVDKAAFATAAMTAAETDYIPAGMEGDVVAHTKTIGGGESTTIEFEAPAVGTYEFTCTFPGHYAMMSGTFTVKAAE